MLTTVMSFCVFKDKLAPVSHFFFKELIKHKCIKKKMWRSPAVNTNIVTRAGSGAMEGGGGAESIPSGR